MSEFEDVAPLREDELSRLPVFPLPRVVFFPGSTLPLHIFEPRYREMMEDCIAKGPQAMAIALLQAGWEDDYDGRPPVHTIASAGRIIDWHRRRDGRFDLLLHGVTRVRLDELPSDGLRYRRARATPLDERTAQPEAIAAMIGPVLNAASSVSAIVRARHADFELGVDEELAPGALADRIADRLIADVDLRQRLLEQCDVKVRLALVHDALLELLARIAPTDGDLH